MFIYWRICETFRSQYRHSLTSDIFLQTDPSINHFLNLRKIFSSFMLNFWHVFRRCVFISTLNATRKGQVHATTFMPVGLKLFSISSFHYQSINIFFSNLKNYGIPVCTNINTSAPLSYPIRLSTSTVAIVIVTNWHSRNNWKKRN